MANTYYTGLSDITMAQEMLAKTPNLFISKFEFEGTGVIDLTAPTAATLTPATSPAWTVDEFNSSTFLNLQILDDTGVVGIATVDDTDATTITFDSTAVLLESTGASGAGFTDTNTYQFRILTPSNTDVNGPFFGYSEGNELNLTDEFMDFKYSVPKKLIRSDLMERAGEVTGGQVSFVNEDIFSTIFSTDQYGLQTAQFSLGVGSDPDTNRFYRLVFNTQDVNNRNLDFIVRRVQFRSNGNILAPSESGHKMLQFSANIISDPFYPDNADMMQIIRAD